MHFLDFISLRMIISIAGWKEEGIFLDHCVFVSEVTCEEDGAHVALEEYHSCAWDVLGIKHSELDVDLVFHNGEGVSLVIVVRVDVLEFGILVHKILLSLMRAMNVAIVPESGDSLIVVAVEVGEEMLEGVLWEGFAEIEVVHYNIRVCYYARHTLYYK